MRVGGPGGGENGRKARGVRAKAFPLADTQQASRGRNRAKPTPYNDLGAHRKENPKPLIKSATVSESDSVDSIHNQIYLQIHGVESA